MGRRTLLLIASILVAALGTALVWLYVQSAESRLRQGQALVRAFFLTSDLPAGTQGDAAFRVSVAKSVPTDIESTDLVTSPADIATLRLKTDAVQGQLLLRNMFTQGTPTGATAGRGFVSITIADANRVPLQIAPGQQVAVYALGRAAPQLVVDKIMVASVGSTTTTRTAAGTVSQTIVAFDADPDQAVRLLAIGPSGGQAALYILGPNTQAKG